MSDKLKMDNNQKVNFVLDWLEYLGETDRNSLYMRKVLIAGVAQMRTLYEAHIATVKGSSEVSSDTFSPIPTFESAEELSRFFYSLLNRLKEGKYQEAANDIWLELTNLGFYTPQIEIKGNQDA